MRENSRSLFAFLRASGCDSNFADDIWQETMLVAWRKLDEFDRSRPFGPWLRGIAGKILLSHRRKSHRMLLVSDEADLEYLSQRLDEVHHLAGDTLDEKLDALRDCIAKLPDHDRQCVELRFKSELMPAAIAAQIDVGLETVKKRLVQCRRAHNSWSPSCYCKQSR